jgi:hypothetical protein
MRSPAIAPLPPPDARPSSRSPSLLPSRSNAFLDNLVRQGLLDPGDRELFLTQRFDRLREYTTEERLGQALIACNLLTHYQFDRLLGDKAHGLVLGSYRVLKELGKGGMGVVYLAEHRLMKRRAAIKVLPVDENCHASLRQRFLDEMRILADLSHPNVVQAIDAGELPGHGPNSPLLYLVTELVEGGDLEKHLARRGLAGVSRPTIPRRSARRPTSTPSAPRCSGCSPANVPIPPAAASARHCVPFRRRSRAGCATCAPTCRPPWMLWCSRCSPGTRPTGPPRPWRSGTLWGRSCATLAHPAWETDGPRNAF